MYSSGLHPPPANRAVFDVVEDDVLNEDADENDHEQPRENVRDLKVHLVGKNEPAKTAPTHVSDVSEMEPPNTSSAAISVRQA